MQRLARLVPFVAVLLFALPSASGHGAAAAREIDTRILADDDGLIGFSACIEGEACVPGLASESWDLIVLEAREAYLPDGKPALVLRTVYQTDDAHDGRTVTISFDAGGKSQVFGFESKGEGVITDTFDLVRGPFPAFDGFPFAVDGYVSYAKLGLKPGDQLTNVRVVSAIEGEEGDVMPGTWMSNGVEVPYVPSEPEIPGAAAAGTYTLAGPAPLVTIATSSTALDLGKNATRLTLTLTSKLTSTPQFVNLTMASPPGIVAALSQSGVALDGGATKTVTVTVSRASTAGTLNVTIRSDLDYVQKILVNVLPAPVKAVPSNSTCSSTCSPATSSSASKKSPLPALPLELGLLMLAVASRRNLNPGR